MAPEMIALVLALLIQFAGLVWGAAQLSSAVKALKESVDKLNVVVENIDSKVNLNHTRLAVIENRLDQKVTRH